METSSSNRPTLIRVALCLSPLLLAGLGGCNTLDQTGTDPRGGDQGPLGRTSAPVCTIQPAPQTCPTILWPGGVIYYDYDQGPYSVPGPEASPGTMQANIRNAMNEWETTTGGRISFVRSSTDNHRVVIQNNNNCSSPIGWQNAVTIANWTPSCPFEHELGHIIGFINQQQRWDRGRFIELDPTAPGCDDWQTYMRCVLTDDGPTDFGYFDDLSCMQSGAVGTPPDMVFHDTGLPASQGGAVQAWDGAKAVEMYARENPFWKKGVSMSIDVGSQDPLDQSLAPGVFILSGSSPAIVRGNQHLYTIARGTDNYLYWRFGKPFGEPAWEGWQFVGGAGAISSPSAAFFNGTLYISERTTDSVMVYPYSESGGFGGAINIGAPPLPSKMSDTAMAAPATFGLYVILGTANGQLWNRRMSPNGIWADWQWVGGSDLQMRGAPAAVARSSTQLDIFAGSSISGYVRQISFNNSGWSLWTIPSAGPCCLPKDGKPAVASSYADRMDVFFRDINGMLQWMKYTTAGGYELAQPIGGTVWGSPAAVGMAGPRVDLVTFGPGGLWHRRHFRHTRGDWDGDGRADFAVYRSSDASIHIRPFGGGAEIVKPVPGGTASTIVRALDIDADGRTDKVWITPQGMWSWEQSADLRNGQTQFGSSGFIPVVGDFNGDSRDDLGYFSPNDNFTWFISPNVPGTNTVKQYGAAGDIPVVADYEGDGREDIAVWRPSTGSWRVMLSSTNTETTVGWGGSSDKPVPGDYDGDGKADPAFFRASDNKWHIRNTTNPNPALNPLLIGPFGTSTDRLVPRDYDGDGKTDAAFFRPSTGTWSVRLSSTGGTVQITFGQSSDVVL
jgi:hypothetical protein